MYKILSKSIKERLHNKDTAVFGHLPCHFYLLSPLFAFSPNNMYKPLVIFFVVKRTQINKGIELNRVFVKGNTFTRLGFIF